MLVFEVFIFFRSIKVVQVEWILNFESKLIEAGLNLKEFFGYTYL